MPQKLVWTLPVLSVLLVAAGRLYQEAPIPQQFAEVVLAVDGMT